MNNKIFRVQKSEWVLLSFYFLAFFILLFYSFIFARMVFVSLWSLFRVDFLTEILPGLLLSFKVTSLGTLICVIPASILTVFLVLCEGHKFGLFCENVLRFMLKAPLILSGISLVFWMRGLADLYLLSLIYFFIIFPRLTLRWFEVARGLNRNLVESALSIGMGFWDILYFIYLKKFFPQFTKNLFVVFCMSLGVVTPFVFFMSHLFDGPTLLSLTIFKEALEVSAENSISSVMVLVLLVSSFVAVYLDPSVEAYGEWNG